MHFNARVFGPIAALTLAACSGMPPAPSESKIVDVTSVVDLVRDELAIYLTTPIAEPAKEGACYKKVKGQYMNLQPLDMTITLKAVSGRENDPSVGLKAPLGVLSIDPNYSGAYSNSRTQTITLPLTIPDPGTKIKAIKLDRSNEKDHLVAAALNSFRQSILSVDHDKQPCLQFDGKRKFKVSLAFDVVNKSTTGVALQLAIFKIGDKEVFTNEAHQTLDIELALVGSKQTMMLNEIE